MISILTFQRFENEIRDFRVICIIFSQYLLYFKRNASYDTSINPLNEITEFTKQIVGSMINSLTSFNVVVTWTPMT